MAESRKERNQEKNLEQRNKKFPPTLCLKPDLIEKMYKDLIEDKFKKNPPKIIYIKELGHVKFK